MLLLSERAGVGARLALGLLVTLVAVVSCGSSDAKTAGGGGSGSGSGGAGAGAACSSITVEADCTARADCHAISEQILCPGSGAPCPFQFKYCSDTRCGPACSAAELCVGSQTVGGAVGGAQAAPTYACQSKPSACSASVDCACAGTACAASYNCQSSSPGQIECVQAVP
ncbi:MAG TPA: hypothetical protein VIK01_19510 [Polyangiaceae bacterium]